MINRETENQAGVRNKPLEVFLSPAGSADHNAKSADDEAFWAALERYLENCNNRLNTGFFNHTCHAEFVTELILEQMK